jgi:DNA-binding NarL/FixJ family response regulator
VQIGTKVIALLPDADTLDHWSTGFHQQESGMGRIKKQVVLADGQPVVLEGVASRLHGSEDFEVVAAVGDSDRAFFEVFERCPDLVLMELELEGRGALTLAAEVLDRLPATRVVFFTSYDTDVFLDTALRLQVHGYFLKSEPVEELLAGLRRVCRGERAYSERVLDRLEANPDGDGYQVKSQSELTGLSLRQLQVLRHLARGATVREVAEAMRLSERAIESHKYRIMQKIGIHDRVLLTRYAIREGLLPA